MNDRELLELAAKAAGIPAYWSDDGTIQQRPIMVVKAGGGMGTMPYESEWNPLRDNDPAFVLAVKLHMHIQVDDEDLGRVFVFCASPDGPFEEETGRDPYAATRRAIVRAAAELGRKEQA